MLPHLVSSTSPVARAGRHIKLFWEVEQAGNDRVLTCAGSDTIGGNIFTSVAGNNICW